MLDPKDKNRLSRNEILDQYYSEVYQQYLFGKDLQGFGIRYFESAIEKFWKCQIPKRVLEIGGGSGEHLPYVKYVPQESYTLLDLRPVNTEVHVNQSSVSLIEKTKFVIGNAEELPFDDEHFDRVLSTCLLHHVNDVFTVLQEARRVAKSGGEIAFLIPTDPGVLNRLVKKIVSYPKLRKLSKTRPELFYALDHKNHIGSIIEQIKCVFKNDELKFHFRPFYVKSWNLNLLTVVHVTKNSSSSLNKVI